MNFNEILSQNRVWFFLVETIRISVFHEKFLVDFCHYLEKYPVEFNKYWEMVINPQLATFFHFPRFYSPCIYKNKAGIHLYITAIRYYCVLSPETIRYDIDQFWQCDIDPWDRRQCNANIPPRSGGADPRRRFNGSGSDRHDKPDPQPTLKIIWIRIGLKITANHGCLKKMVFH